MSLVRRNMVDVSMTVLRRNEVNGEGRSPDPASAAFFGLSEKCGWITPFAKGRVLTSFCNFWLEIAKAMPPPLQKRWRQV